MAMQTPRSPWQYGHHTYYSAFVGATCIVIVIVIVIVTVTVTVIVTVTATVTVRPFSHLQGL